MDSETRISYFLDACNLGILDSYDLIYSGKKDYYVSSSLNSKSLKVLNTNSYCSLCDGISDKECLETLTTLFQALSEQTRMAYEVETLQSLYDCAQISDKACLLELEGVLYSLSSEERLSFFKNACNSGVIKATENKEVVRKKSKCLICAEWPDDFCFTELQSRAQSLPKSILQTALFESYTDVDSICDGYSTNLCHTFLEKRFTESDKDSQNTVLLQMCTDGYLNFPFAKESGTSMNKQNGNSAELNEQPPSIQLRGQISEEKKVVLPSSFYVFMFIIGAVLLIAGTIQVVIFARRSGFRPI